MTRKFKPFPATGRLRRVAAEVDARRGIARGPWVLPDLWKPGLGRAQLLGSVWSRQRGNGSGRLFLGWPCLPGSGGREGWKWPSWERGILFILLK